ncbi:MAG: hypothetical protein LBK13_03470, partial [Spirochaetales bacterium]|nr:hypothetical protein [Spirochaetales bacterium]
MLWAHFFERASPAQKNRAIRSNSSVLLSQALRDFHYYPLRAPAAAGAMCIYTLPPLPLVRAQGIVVEIPEGLRKQDRGIGTDSPVF